jgi:hypothetical protein
MDPPNCSTWQGARQNITVPPYELQKPTGSNCSFREALALL